MDANMAQMMEQMKRNPALLQSLMQSKDGQMLLQMLTQGDQGFSLQQAVQSAMKGDTSGMMAMMDRIRQSPAGADLMNRITKAAQK